MEGTTKRGMDTSYLIRPAPVVDIGTLHRYVEETHREDLPLGFQLLGEGGKLGARDEKRQMGESELESVYNMVLRANGSGGNDRASAANLSDAGSGIGESDAFSLDQDVGPVAGGSN
ncbi:MAG: hypothetical protein M1827_004971 [Pycnora praestabilis]|nr:MAG: hypothetical protein M1827_004971 [Pycnora praestabilis]